VLGKPPRRQGGAYLWVPALVFVRRGEGGFDAFGLARPLQRLQQVRSHRRREDIRRDEGGGQPLAGLEVRQRLFVTAKSEVEQAARIVEACPGGGIWTSLILLWISRSMPDRTCTDLAGCRLRCHQGGSAMAADGHATARTWLAATEAIRAAGRRPASRRPGSRPAGFMSSFPGPDGRSAEPRRVVASGPATPVERLLASAVPTRRRESPKHVTPAHQARREAAQV
jgi:hypothetical protein